MRPPEGPPASEGNVHDHPQLLRLLDRELQHLQPFGREVGNVRDSPTRIIHIEWVDRLNLHPTDPFVVHLLQLPGKFLFCHGGSEPPPAHEGPAIHGGIPEFFQVQASHIRIPFYRPWMVIRDSGIGKAVIMSQK